ncbi:MAG: 3-phosphoshikimate 1-carboxyvinyltransferase [Salibacteraceae bacterium]
MIHSVRAPRALKVCRLSLPASKSISNRLLICQAIAGSDLLIGNLSNSDDTVVLNRLLQQPERVMDVGRAGTAMRFLSAFLSTQPGEWILTGDERMKKRPIEGLVNALRKLGADIEYLEEIGYPPLQIKGKKLSGTTLRMEAGTSSQFLTALMLIAPSLDAPLEILLEGEVVSRPYLQMTIEVLRWYQIKVSVSYRRIVVHPGVLKARPILVEADWSAASYWYEILALSNGGEVFLEGLKDYSWQGDRVVASLFEPLGVKSEFKKDGVRLYKSQYAEVDRLSLDGTEFPDLVQTLAAVAVGLRLPANMTGLRTLRVKETDRIQALDNELSKLGVAVKSLPDQLELRSRSLRFPADVQFETYGDHRMAMALAPLAFGCGRVKINDPGVVSKSYPNYWEHLEKVGFIIGEET